jgi:hypothetical protein
MAKARQYPDTYGVPVKGAQEDMLTPLTIDEEGDKLVPRNDMKEVAGRVGDKDYISPDPMGYLAPFGKDGKKG